MSKEERGRKSEKELASPTKKKKTITEEITPPIQHKVKLAEHEQRRVERELKEKLSKEQADFERQRKEFNREWDHE